MNNGFESEKEHYKTDAQNSAKKLDRLVTKSLIETRGDNRCHARNKTNLAVADLAIAFAAIKSNKAKQRCEDAINSIRVSCYR